MVTDDDRDGDGLTGADDNYPGIGEACDDSPVLVDLDDGGDNAVEQSSW